MSRAGLGSTYRLQLPGLAFDGATALVPYLDQLGVTTLYVSPISTAVPGSRHGYDVLDPTAVDPTLGGRAGLDRLLATLSEYSMRLLLDIVPNHMSTSTDNPWWFDVLSRGRHSPFAEVFDIDWDRGAGRVVLPVLDAPISDVLDSGQASVERLGTTSVLRLGGQAFPLMGGADPSVVADPTLALPLLEAQHYRLIEWRRAADEANYRRFFDINGLVGVRVEDPAVFERTHSLVIELAGDERVAGFRVDHLDGLRRPGEYLEHLSAAIGARRREPPVVVVEKILARGEQLPEQWVVEGTTGYEFADMTTAVLTDGDGAVALERVVHGAPAMEVVEWEARLEILADSFSGQWRAVAGTVASHLGPETCARDEKAMVGVAALTAALPVYRTYLSGNGASDIDRDVLDRACSRARRLGPDSTDDAGRVAGALVQMAESGAALDGVERWQQLSATVVAKGTEDTALYRFGGLLSTADVGSDPARPAVDVEAFHRWAERRGHGALNTTSTHDAKRSRSVRCRLAVLSEVPWLWADAVTAWRRRHHRLTGDVDLGALAEHVVYQSILGLWGDGGDQAARVGRAVVKAAREAGLRTSWIAPDAAYEAALVQTVRALISGEDQQFCSEMDSVVADIGAAALANELAAVVLAATVPGVTDVFQGTETVRPLLVDPDNRRPVPFDQLALSLGAVAHHLVPADAGADPPDLVLHATTRLLHLRRSHPELFEGGHYTALEARGPSADHVIAYARQAGDDRVVVLVPRLSRQLSGPSALPVGTVWGDTSVELPPSWPVCWTEVLSGRSVCGPEVGMGAALDALPAAVLVPTAGR